MWDLWIWRDNVGWWLEDDGYDSIEDAAAGAEELRTEEKAVASKFGTAIVPTGSFQKLWGSPFAVARK